ncbi:MAG: response regulator transcription factor [Ilumatobacteraceae bacterium]
MIRIVLADDHSLIRSSLTRLLSAEPDFELVGAASDGRQALELVKEHSPDVVLMDLHMPNVDGVTAIGQLTEMYPDVAVIALSAFEEPSQVTSALAAGAQGYLVKDVEPAVLLAGIRAAVKGGAPLSPSVAAQLIRNGVARQSIDQALTERDRKILRMIVEGRNNQEIGEELGMSKTSVTSHCGRLFKRINAADRTQAAVWATRNLPPIA